MDGEIISVRNVAGTEIVYHGSCWSDFLAEQLKISQEFGFEFDLKDFPSFLRPFYLRQIAVGTGVTGPVQG